MSGLVAGEGDLFLDPLFAIESLAAHRATLTWHFAGTVDGQPSDWTETTTLRTATQPPVAERIVERTNVPGLPMRSWAALADGTVFETVDSGSCTGVAAGTGRDRFVEPAAQLPGLIGGTKTGTDVVDGANAELFTFDGPAMGLVAPTTATGRAWISPSDNLLLRYEVEIIGGPEFLGEGVSGRVTGTYALSGVGVPFDLAIPAGCPAGVIVGPQPIEATVIRALPGQTELSTTLDVKAATAFYHDTSLAFGWRPVGEPKTSGDLAILRFDQGGLDIVVVITGRAGGSEVIVTAARS